MFLIFILCFDPCVSIAAHTISRNVYASNLSWKSIDCSWLARKVVHINSSRSPQTPSCVWIVCIDRGIYGMCPVCHAYMLSMSSQLFRVQSDFQWYLIVAMLRYILNWLQRQIGELAICCAHNMDQVVQAKLNATIFRLPRHCGALTVGKKISMDFVLIANHSRRLSQRAVASSSREWRNKMVSNKARFDRCETLDTNFIFPLGVFALKKQRKSRRLVVVVECC